jgi:hypothetical protein
LFLLVGSAVTGVYLLQGLGFPLTAFNSGFGAIPEPLSLLPYAGWALTFLWLFGRFFMRLLRSLLTILRASVIAE